MTSDWKSIGVLGWSEYLRDQKSFFEDGNGSSDKNPFNDLKIEGHHELAFGWGENKYTKKDSNHIRLFHYGANLWGSGDAGKIKFSIRAGYKVQISLIPETHMITESKYFDSPYGYKWNFCELDSFKEGGLYRSNSPPPKRLLMYSNGKTGYKNRYYSCMTFEMVSGDELVLDVADDFRGSGGGLEVYKLTVGNETAGWEIDDDIDVNVVVSITGVSRISENPQLVAEAAEAREGLAIVQEAITSSTYVTKLLEEATLRRGNRGSSVEELQRLLKLKGYVENVDGIFGKKTEAGVIKLQSLMVNYGGSDATRYENGVFNPNLYQDVSNFDSSHLTMSDVKIRTLYQYHDTADLRDPFSELLINGNHSFDTSGIELNLESNSSIIMKIRDNWAVKLKVLVNNYDYFQDNLMFYKQHKNIFSVHNPTLPPNGTSNLEVLLSGGDELIFDVSGNAFFTPNFFLKLQGGIVSQENPEIVGGNIIMEIVDVLTPQDVWVRYRDEKPVSWGRDYGDKFYETFIQAADYLSHLNQLGVNSTLEYGVNVNAAYEAKLSAEQVFVIKNLGGGKYSLESTYKAGVGMEAGSTKFGFGRKRGNGVKDKTKSAIIDVGLGFSASASIYGSWATIFEFSSLENLKSSLPYFLLGPAYNLLGPVQELINGLTSSTANYSRIGDKFSVGLMAEGSAVSNIVLGNSEHPLVNLGAQLGASGSISVIYDLNYASNKLSIGFEIERVGSVSGGLSLGFLSRSEKNNGVIGNNNNIFKFGSGAKVEVIMNSITYNSTNTIMDVNEPLKPFKDSEGKLSFSTEYGTISMGSPLEQIKLTFDVSWMEVTYEIVLDLKTSFQQLVNILVFMKDPEDGMCLFGKLENMADVITDISLEINKVVGGGLGNIGLELKVAGVGGGISVTQKETQRTSLFKDNDGDSLTFTPTGTSANKIEKIKNKILVVLSENFKGL